MFLVFATWAAADYQGEALNKHGAHRRLLSYYELKDKPAHLLSDYVRDGKCGKPKLTRKKLGKRVQEDSR